jgi:hypothetical protein
VSRVVSQLLEVADELTDVSYRVHRVRTGWTKARNPIYTDHKVTEPSLLSQLYEAALDPATADEKVGARPKPSSRPPLATEALSAYMDVSAGAQRWVRSLRLANRTTVESNIRALIGVTGQLDLDTLESMLEEMKLWRRWAMVLIGTAEHQWRPRCACPVCGTRHSIRINVKALLGYCTECQHWWEGEDDLKAMGTAVQAAQAA